MHIIRLREVIVTFAATVHTAVVRSTRLRNLWHKAWRVRNTLLILVGSIIPVCMSMLMYVPHYRSKQSRKLSAWVAKQVRWRASAQKNMLKWRLRAKQKRRRNSAAMGAQLSVSSRQDHVMPLLLSLGCAGRNTVINANWCLREGQYLLRVDRYSVKLHS